MVATHNEPMAGALLASPTQRKQHPSPISRCMDTTKSPSVLRSVAVYSCICSLGGAECGSVARGGREWGRGTSLGGCKDRDSQAKRSLPPPNRNHKKSARPDQDDLPDEEYDDDDDAQLEDEVLVEAGGAMRFAGAGTGVSSAICRLDDDALVTLFCLWWRTNYV